MTRSVWLLADTPPPPVAEAPPPAAARTPRAALVVPPPVLGTIGEVPVSPERRLRAITPLDLTLPRSVIDADTSGASLPPAPGEPFHRGVARRLAAERQRRGERNALAANARARDGLAPQDYGREAALGEQTKVDGECFELREDPGLGGTRWWREPCTDTRRDGDIVWPPAESAR